MQYCPNCGSINNAKDILCIVCGKEAWILIEADCNSFECSKCHCNVRITRKQASMKVFKGKCPKCKHINTCYYYSDGIKENAECEVKGRHGMILTIIMKALIRFKNTLKKNRDKIFIGLGVLIFIYFVWPTPWEIRWHKDEQLIFITYRNRITGAICEDYLNFENRITHFGSCWKRLEK